MLEQEITQLERDIAKVKESIVKIDRGEYITRRRWYDIQIQSCDITADEMIEIMNEIKAKSFYKGQSLEIVEDCLCFQYEEVTESPAQASYRRRQLVEMLERDETKLRNFVEIENRLKEKEL